MKTPTICLLLIGLMPISICAQTWETFRKDFGRSGFVEAELDPGFLILQWHWKSGLPPEPAWDGPARWDAFAELKDLPAMRQYDACFHPVSDGKRVYLGSSSQDSIYCLDLTSGKQNWVFVAGGPIRIAPTLNENHLLFGCDDGFAYCLDKVTGELIWRFNPSLQADAEQRRVINNDRLISFYPIRTGVVVRDGVAYFAASFLPWRESFLCGVKASDGKLDPSAATFVTRHENATLEGPLLIAENRLIVPQGRIAPLLFDRTNGKQLGNLPGGGGVTIVLTDKGEVARAEGGRAAKAGQVGVFRGKERVASFPRGRSIVVREKAFYVIDQNKVYAASRQANELLWQMKIDQPLEIVMIGTTLIVGSKDSITAINASTGETVWETEVQGRVFGLAFANGRLLAATDKGGLYCFQANAKTKWTVPPEKKEEKRHSIPVPPLVGSAENLAHRWVFHRSGMTDANQKPVLGDRLQNIKVVDQVGKLDLPLVGTATSFSLGTDPSIEAATINGMFPADEKQLDQLPAKDLTIESWVRVDQSTTWGGILGCIQDDGATEHGWLLGYNGDKFSLAIAGSKSGLTYLKSPTSFEKGKWYHVAGTYDGQEMKLYVNGKTVAASNAENGPISYATKKFFTIGGYRDANESFPLKGAIHEVKLYDKALSAETIAGNFNSMADRFPKTPRSEFSVAETSLSWGPYVRFIKPGVAEIRFGTRSPSLPHLILSIKGQPERRIKADREDLNHRLTVENLPFRQTLTYRIVENETQESVESMNRFEMDTHFDWTPVFSKGMASENAVPENEILAGLPNPSGISLLFGTENIRFAETLVKDTSQTVILILDDLKRTFELRDAWIKKYPSLYGKRLSVQSIPVENLPGAIGSLVAVSPKLAAEHIHVYKKLVRPSGGMLTDTRKILWRRGKIEGAGEWSHMYGLADNSAFGGEHLGGASTRQDLVTNWIGRPGPRYQTDRQNRKPSPLSVNGRLYLQGQQRIIALDSYSGTVLWSVEAPPIMRWNIPRDSSNWCADQDGIFVAAEDKAWRVDGATGDLKQQIAIPKDVRSQFAPATQVSWGYIARHRELLLGTATHTDAIYTSWWGKTQWFDSPTGEDTHLVVGRSLFGLNKDSGDLAWSYNGRVLHPTITIDGNRIFFIENISEGEPAKDLGRLSLDEKLSLQLVCLDVSNGEVLYRQPVERFEGKVSALYIAAGGPPNSRALVMVASEAKLGLFSVSCIDPEQGKINWKKQVKWEANHHGKHISRPAIENDLVYLRPEVLKLSDGATIKRGFPSGHGCSSYTLCKDGLFSRLGETTWWDVRKDRVNRFSRVRTDCWISAIPAQGMLLSAEGGGGCSCGSWLETSIGFLPRAFDQPLPPEPSRNAP